MGFLHCCLLFAVFIFSCPLFISSQYLLDEVLTTGPIDTSVEKLAQAMYLFTTDFHEKINKSNPEGNVFFSPTSIYVALAMLYAGSEGETKSKLTKTLHLEVFDSDESELYKSIKILLQTVNSTTNNYTLKMANRLYGQQGLEFKDEYLNRTEEYFHAELEELDFKNDSSGSRSKINSWVASMTSGWIDELFPKGAITSDTVLVLANAVYYDNPWLNPFDEEETKPQTFFASEDQEIQVPMMHLLKHEGLRYTSSDGSFRLLELPYSDESVSMIIVLDDRKDDFDSFLRAVRIDSPWDEDVDVFTDVGVRLSMPKFNIQQTVDLTESSEALGMKNLFEGSDLSGIADSAPSFKLSMAYMTSGIAVGAAGTEAAGATGLVVKKRSQRKIIDFIVDKKFLFFVIEKTTGCPLFFGHIENPLKSN